ncbi:MAG TPA: hypothetical protein VIY08_03325 [Candidatus Nitrosocosmicus sp.]
MHFNSKLDLTIDMINLLSCPPVIVATLSGRSYYKITSTLKSLDLNFLSLSPQEAALSDAKIIITTLNESKIVKRNDVFLDTDLEYSPLSVKAKILQNFMSSYCYACDDVIVGVDPGKRIGISVLYYNFELDRIIVLSVQSAYEKIALILSSIDSQKKIVRIGDGSMTISYQIANLLKKYFKDEVIIEIVNEYGTSIRQGSEINRRGIRDISSARKIAFRNGWVYER